MKNSIKKLLSSAVIAFVSISVNFNTNARVTREVAEATLPYLMEAVGIPQAQRTPKHQKAVISMIYTDKGQQEMVEWAKKGDFPESLKAGGFETEDLYSDTGQMMNTPGVYQNAIDSIIANLNKHKEKSLTQSNIISIINDACRDAYIGALFPCGPGTFSSYAAHQSRLGHCVLNDGTPTNVCSAVIDNQANIKEFTQDAKKLLPV